MDADNLNLLTEEERGLYDWAVCEGNVAVRNMAERLTSERALHIEWRERAEAGLKRIAELEHHLAEVRKVLNLVADELHEMQLAQRNGNPPRNPELTQNAVSALDAIMKRNNDTTTAPR